jgi:branched-chain amino acid transport system substrate-binding protein
MVHDATGGEGTVTNRIATRAGRALGTMRAAGLAAISSVCSNRASRRRFLSLGLASSALALAACSIGSGASQLATGAIAAAAVGQSPDGANSKVEAKVALLLPLSGTAQASAVAKGMKQAAEMALFDLNNPSFQMVVKDTGGTPDGARMAATEAAADGAELIIGPLFAKSVRAVQPIAQQAGLPMIAFSNDRSVAGNGVYLLSFMANEEVERIVAFATARGKRSLAALIPSSAYGNLMAAAFKASAQRNGAHVIAIERYPANSTGLLGPTQKLAEHIQTARTQGYPVDAVFLPGGPESLPNLTPLVGNAANGGGATIQLLGSGAWDSPNLGRNPALIGSWYPAPDPRGWQAFSEKFSRSFGAAPPRVAALAHDALTVAIRLASQHARGLRYSGQTIGRATGFDGVDGPFRFNADGTSRHSLAVLEVQRYQAVVVDTAAPGFEGAPVSAVPTAALSRLDEQTVAVRN